MNSNDFKKTNRKGPRGKFQRGTATELILKCWELMGEWMEPNSSLHGQSWGWDCIAAVHQREEQPHALRYSQGHGKLLSPKAGWCHQCPLQLSEGGDGGCTHQCLSCANHLFLTPGLHLEW